MQSAQVVIDLIIIQDGAWLMPSGLHLQLSKYVTKILRTDVTITSKVFINKPIKIMNFFPLMAKKFGTRRLLRRSHRLPKLKWE